MTTENLPAENAIKLVFADWKQLAPQNKLYAASSQREALFG